jgi:selenocysteine-specific elongation factor
MYVIGTAGHVDHGKSTLVQALTGIDPDRLREEKERGMTIELGFAWLTLPSGQEVSIVDVPGHERFIKNMLAGIGGIDLALLVIAANESVMPQTREHLAILDMLQVKKGLAVIAKKEIVDEEILELVIAEVEDVLKGTTLHGSPIVTVSAITGEGLPELIETLDTLLDTTETRKDYGRPRMSIDRSFTMSGFGTVVTGTLIDGSLSVGAEVEILPSGKMSRIRGLQSHRQKIETASPGRRLAVNLSGVSHDDIERGEVLTIPGWLRSTIAADVRLHLLPDAPRSLKHNGSVTFHTGATETVARVRLLEQDIINPGEETLAQIRLDNPLTLVKGDYFVIRSSEATLGGGTVLDPYAKRHRRHHSPTIERLEVMELGTQDEILVQILQSSEPCSLQALADSANLSIEETKILVEQLASTKEVIVLGTNAITQRSLVYSSLGWTSLLNKARNALESYHKEHPLRRGIQKEELRSRLSLSGKEFTLILSRFVEDGAVIEETNSAWLPQHQVSLSDIQTKLVEQYVSQLQSNPYSPPTDASLDDDLLTMLVDEGRVVKVSETVIYDAEAYQGMVDKIVFTIKEQGKINVAQVRDLFQTSRKYALSLLEYLDQQSVTRRVGDDRVLR